MLANHGDPRVRWELYRLLAEPVRPRLLALAAREELGVGELAELLREGQPKVSRHAAVLRDAGLLTARRQGTWTLLRLAPGATDDAVVADAVRAGTRACELDGTFGRLDAVIEARSQETREFFARGGRPDRAGPPLELPAYLCALAALLPRRHLAVDVGTGDGALLEVLAPIFEIVVAVDRSAEQLDRARTRVERRALPNVVFVRDEIDGAEVARAVARARGNGQRGPASRDGAGADAVFAARVLHHAPAPRKALASLVRLARPATAAEPGGAVIVLDYEAHDDIALREQADLWLGFDPAELRSMAEAAGLRDVTLRRLPRPWQGDGADAHLTWQLLTGRRGDEAVTDDAPARTRNRHGDSPKRTRKT